MDLQRYDFYLKQGDLYPSIVYEVPDVLTLSGASAKWAFWPIDGSRAATVVTAIVQGDGSLKRVQYDWQSTDTAIPGEYYGEFRLTMPGAKPLTAPNSDNPIRFLISPLQA